MVDLREELANLAHTQWTGWMEYLFSKCTTNQDGTVTIPKSSVNHWRRQIGTAYNNLSEAEKNSDRKEADRVIDTLGLWFIKAGTGLVRSYRNITKESS